MTITPDAPTQAENVQVRLDRAGTPFAIRLDGQLWVVDPDTDTQHWYGRDSWWHTRRNAPVGSGDLVSIEYWRVQARTTATAALRTFTLRREPLATTWLLASIADDS